MARPRPDTYMNSMNTGAKTARPYQTVPMERVGITRLYRDFLAGASSTRPFFGPVFDDEPATGTLVERLASRSYPRAELHASLRDLAAEVKATAAARAALDQFGAGAPVVFAGQQAGLFGG